MSIYVNGAQNDFNVFEAPPSEVAMGSLDEIMSSKVLAMNESEEGLPPGSAEETLFKEFAAKVLDGTVRNQKEISLLLKEMASALGIPGHDLVTKKYAINAVIQMIDKEVGIDNSQLRKTLMSEFNSLRFTEKLHRKLLERIVAPTVQNGGLDFYGDKRKDLFKN
jgi:hypothetical protein